MDPSPRPPQWYPRSLNERDPVSFASLPRGGQKKWQTFFAKQNLPKLLPPRKASLQRILDAFEYEIEQEWIEASRQHTWLKRMRGTVGNCSRGPKRPPLGKYHDRLIRVWWEPRRKKDGHFRCSRHAARSRRMIRLRCLHHLARCR